MSSDGPEHLSFAGDYNLRGVLIEGHNGDVINIQKLIQEFNIYESIDSPSVTGVAVITDATNQIGNLPIQGTERIMFKLSTPGTECPEDIIDASELTGHPMYIYSITERVQLNQSTIAYKLHFGSREFVRNLRTKVSKSYSGRIDDMAKQILSEKNGLDTRKKIHYQPTRNSDKIVIPNLPPLKAVSMLAKRALPEGSKSAGYHFYETTKGFHFRSWESMCSHYGRVPRIPVQKFHYVVKNITDNNLVDNADPEKQDTKDKMIHDIQSVESFKIVQNFHNTAVNTYSGTYGHRVITHNLFNKSYKISDYHYHNQYNEFIHADFSTKDSSTDEKFSVVNSPVDFDDKGVSDYPESRVSLVPTTQFLHNEETGNYGVDVDQDGALDGIRISQENQIQGGTTIEMTVKGQSYIEPGDVILFDLRPPQGEGQTNDRKNYDKQYSGRYIVCSIRHRVTDIDYKLILVVKKDSVREPFGDGNDKFQGEPLREHPEFQTVGSRNRSPGR